MSKLVWALPIVVWAGSVAAAGGPVVTSLSALVDHGGSSDVVMRWRYADLDAAPEVLAEGSYYQGMCSDRDGSLYVSTVGGTPATRVHKFPAPSGDPAAIFIQGVGGDFRSMVFTPEGDYLVMLTGSFIAYLERYNSAGVYQGRILTLEGFDRYVDMEVGPDGRGYAVRNNSSALSSAIEIFDLATGASFGQIVLSPAMRADDIAIGGDGTIYFAKRGYGEVYKLAPVIGVSPVLVGVVGDYSSGGIAMGPDGNLYVSNGPDIKRMSTSGAYLGAIATLDPTWSFPRFGRLSFGNLALCPADLNGDGLVDFPDYLEFLNLYEAGDARVDFNGDGVVDFADYLEFLNLFDGGC